MPIFDVEANGKQFEIEAPDIQTATAALTQHFGNDQAPAPAGYEGSIAGDVAKSVGIGLVKGAVGLAGLPGDAIDLATRGVDYLAGTKSNESFGKAAGDYAGSGALQGYLEKATGPLYTPKTVAGEYAQTIGEFAPALIGGPGSIATKAATRVALPAIASETAGQISKGTELEPYARVAGGLVGAVAGGKIAGALAKPSAAAVPTADELATAKSAGYKSKAIDDLRIDQKGANRLVDSIQGDLKRNRFSEKQAGQTFDALEGLRKAEFAPNHTMQDFDSTRKMLNKIAGNFANPTDAEAANKAIRAIDAYTLRVPKSDVLAGDARAAGRDLFDARGDAAALFRSQRVTDAIEKAVNNASATHSGGNLQNEIQKQLRSILNNRKMIRGMNADEIAAIRDAAHGSALSNLTRRVGKLLGGGGGLGQLATGSAGAALAGPIGMFGLPALGMAANRTGSAMTKRKALKAAELLRARSPSYGQQNLQGYIARLNHSARPEITDNALRAALLSSAQMPQLSYQ